MIFGRIFLIFQLSIDKPMIQFINELMQGLIKDTIDQ